jgi:hypothetical protein
MKQAVILASLTLLTSAQTSLHNSVSLSDAIDHRLEWQRLTDNSDTVQQITIRICTHFAGWTSVGFNPTAKLMDGAEIYIANKLDEAWAINVRTGSGRFLPTPKEGGDDQVSDVKDAAVACGTTSGVEFTSSVPSFIMPREVNIITAWACSDCSIGYHGRNFNVRREVNSDVG